MPPPFKTRRQHGIRRIRARASDKSQIQRQSAHRASLRGSLESWLEGPTFERGMVVLGVDDGYVEGGCGGWDRKEGEEDGEEEGV